MLKYKIWRYLGLIILAYILFKIDWPQMKNTISEANPLWIIIAFLINIPQIWLKSTRWQLLLSMQRHVIKNRDAFLFYLSSVYLGIITPGRLGEFAKALYLKQAGITNLSRGFSSVLTDRLCDLYLLFMLAMVGLISIVPWPGAYVFGWAGIFCAVAIPSLFLLSGKMQQVVSLFYKKILAAKLPDFAKEGAEQFSKGFQELIGWRMWQAGFLTCLSYALFFLQCFIVAKALAMKITYLEIVPIMAMTNLFTFLPISISGLGTRETALLFLLGPAGISLELILAYSMGVLLVFFVGGGIIGAAAWWLSPLDFSIKSQVT